MWCWGILSCRWQSWCRSMSLVILRSFLYTHSRCGFAVSLLVSMHMRISYPVFCHWVIWLIRSLIRWFLGWCPFCNSICVCWVLTVLVPISVVWLPMQYTDAMIILLLSLPRSSRNDWWPIPLGSWPEWQEMNRNDNTNNKSALMRWFQTNGSVVQEQQWQLKNEQ